MRNTPALPLILLGSLVCIPVGAAGAVSTAGDAGSIPGILLSTALANLSVAFVIVLMFVFGIYAYASLARFAPYHTWIYLYLVSLTGIVWSLFLLNSGGSLADVAFILTTVAGINLIVHILRFDRVQIFTLSPAKAAGVPIEQSAESNDPLLFWNPPRI
jgi:hypothetical protein